MLSGRKGQSATEFVVLGSLILMAFSFLINYSERLNRQQSVMQQSFRAALKEARNANNSASYTKVAFRRMPNVMNPMELGQIQSFSGSGNVFWGDGMNTDEGVSKYQLNEGGAIDIPSRETPDEGSVEESENIFVHDISSELTTTKQENSGNIITTKSLVARDTLKSNIDINGSSYSFTHTLGDGGNITLGTMY